ncbi:MAG: hypothetical protein LH606_02930 [Cytophagaceae bacterium]|nr:hypothetical protein [Cytophagaceae bacterium]
MKTAPAPPPVARRVSLAQLFDALRREGFRLRPDDYVEVQQVLDAFGPQSPDDVRALVAPLLVSSAAEQEKFDRIFAASFQKFDLPDQPIEPLKPPRPFPWGWLLAAVIGLAALGYVAFLWPALAFKTEVKLSDTGPFQVGDALRFSVDSSLRRAAGRQAQWTWDTPDGQRHDNEPEVEVVPEKPGDLVVTLRTRRGRGLLFPNAWIDSSASLSTPIGEAPPDTTPPPPPEKEPTFSLNLTQTGAALQPETRVKTPFRWATWILGGALALFVLLNAWLVIRDALREPPKPPPSIPPDAENPLVRFVSDKPPLEIPFENREAALIARDEAFHQVVRTLRQRTEEETLRLNIPQTLRATLREGGFPTLLFQPRLAETEYLFLIDRSQVRNQQVALFEYLFRAFCRENVGIERFFFRQNFDLFTNETHPNGLSLHQLTDTYRSRTLVVWGNGYPLLYPAYPQVDPAYREVLAEFEARAVLTPVPFDDWGSPEQALQDVFLLLPADLPGQVRLMQAFSEKQTRQDAYLRQPAREFYSIESVDFRRVAQLREYLADEGLLQWLAALALYPRLRWEVLVEMGRALLPPERVNFTNLLKLVRIQWMQEGSLPDQTRLDLLKILTPENEVKARETLLRMLDHAERYFPGEHFFDEEKHLLQVSNRFTLFAHNAQVYADYKPALREFGALRQQGLYPDAAMLRYLENDERQWDTPIEAAGPSPENKDDSDSRLQEETQRIKERIAEMQEDLLYAITYGKVRTSDGGLRTGGSLEDEERHLKTELEELQQAWNNARRTSLDEYFTAQPPDEPVAPEPTPELPPDPRRNYLWAAAGIVLIMFLATLYFRTTPRARELALDQPMPLTVVLDSNACVTSANTDAAGYPRWTVLLNDSLLNINDLRATQSLSLGTLLSGSGSSGGGWGDETFFSQIEAGFRAAFRPVETDSLKLFVNLAVRDTGDAPLQSRLVALTGDTLRVGIVCQSPKPEPPKPIAPLRVSVEYTNASASNFTKIKTFMDALDLEKGYRLVRPLKPVAYTGPSQVRYFRPEDQMAAEVMTVTASRALGIPFTTQLTQATRSSLNRLEVWVNNGAGAAPFVCRPVLASWLQQFNGWEGTYSDRNYSTPTLRLTTSRGSQVILAIDQEVTLNGKTSTVQENRIGVVSRICQQNGVFVVQTTTSGSGQAMLIRGVSKNACRVAVVTLNGNTLSGPQGQVYYDKLVKGATFSRYSVPTKPVSPGTDKTGKDEPPTTEVPKNVPQVTPEPAANQAMQQPIPNNVPSKNAADNVPAATLSKALETVGSTEKLIGTLEFSALDVKTNRYQKLSSSELTSLNELNQALEKDRNLRYRFVVYCGKADFSRIKKDLQSQFTKNTNRVTIDQVQQAPTRPYASIYAVKAAAKY